MKISTAHLYRYSIPLKSPVKLARTVLHQREGLILQITDDSGLSGFGEISPFPGFSRETLDEAETEISMILDCSSDGLTIDYLKNKINPASPSIKFGIESAIIDLESKINGTSIAKLLKKNPRESVSVNGLLTGSTEEILKKATEYSQNSYKAVKLKVSSDRIQNDIELTKLVRKAIGDKVLLRLDANRAWQIDDAQEFCEAVAGCDINYLEEPVVNRTMLIELLKKGATPLPIALDETTREISPKELGQYKVKAIVLKPTLLGFQTTLDFAQEAHRLGITPVIGSSFETGLGLSILAQIAAALNIDETPAGLDTYSWFVEDIIRGSLPVKNGRIILNELAGSETVLNSPLLKKLI